MIKRIVSAAIYGTVVGTIGYRYSRAGENRMLPQGWVFVKPASTFGELTGLSAFLIRLACRNPILKYSATAISIAWIFEYALRQDAKREKDRDS